MNRFWFFIYNVLFLPVLYTVIKTASLLNPKIQKGIKGRKRIFEELILNSQRLDRSKKIIWFHSSSLGEFEQAKPIIQKLKNEKGINVIITFFSPSGYDNSRKYPYADIISYLPFDSKSNAARFINIIRPDLTIMMRYDIWPNMVWELKQKNIPALIVDATMKKSSLRALPVLRSFHKVLFSSISKILTVSKSDAEALNCLSVKLKRLK